MTGEGGCRGVGRCREYLGEDSARGVGNTLTLV